MSSFNSALDAYGIAMSGAGGILVLALVIRLARLRRSRSMAGWTIAVALLLFWSSALAGTVDRIRAPKTASATGSGQADDSAAPEKVPAVENADDRMVLGQAIESEAAIGGSVDPLPRAPTTEVAADGPGTIDELVTAIRSAAAAEDWIAVGQHYATAKAVDPENPALSEAWRSLAAARAKVIWGWMTEAKRIRTEACTDADRLAEAWRKLRTVHVDDRFYRRARVVVARLEACRRKVAWLSARSNRDPAELVDQGLDRPFSL